MLGHYAIGSEAFGELLDAPSPPTVVITGKIGAIGQFAIGQQSSQSAGTVFMQAVNVACAAAVSLLRDVGKVVGVSCGGAVSFIKGISLSIAVASAGAVAVIAGSVFPQSVTVFCATSAATVVSVGKVVSAACSSAVTFFLSFWRARAEQAEAWLNRSSTDETWTERTKDDEGWH